MESLFVLKDSTPWSTRGREREYMNYVMFLQKMDSMPRLLWECGCGVEKDVNGVKFELGWVIRGWQVLMIF